MTVDPKLLTMMTEYMQKTGSALVKMQDIASRAEAMIDKSDQEKVASLSVVKDRAEKLAHALSTARLPTGHTMIEGHEAMKSAAMMLADHERALDVLELVLDTVKDAAQKSAAFELGRTKSAGGKEEKPASPSDELFQSVMKMRT